MNGQNENQLIARTLKEYAKREIPDNPDPWPELRRMIIPAMTKRMQLEREIASASLQIRSRLYPVTKTRRLSFGIVMLALVIGAAALFAAVYIDAGQSTTVLMTESRSTAAGDAYPPLRSVTSDDSQQLIGLPAPDARLTDVLTGEAIQLSSFRGKAVMLNTWATRCPSCLDQLPHMQQVYDQYKDKAQFVSISFGPRDTPARIKPFLDQNKYPWTFLSASDMDAFPYAVQALPTNYFISTDGIIRAVFVGSIDAGSLVRSLDATLTNK